MLKAVLSKNDRRAYSWIALFSIVVFVAVVILGQVQLPVALSFDVHIFARFNAVVNSLVALFLLAALAAVKRKHWIWHKPTDAGGHGSFGIIPALLYCTPSFSGNNYIRRTGLDARGLLFYPDHPYFFSSRYSPLYFINGLSGFDR